MNAEILIESIPKLKQMALHTIAFTYDLNGGGAALGKLVSHCPHLHTLELQSCDLSGKDVEEMTANMPDSTDITRLRLAYNRTTEAAAVGRLLQHVPHLLLLDVRWCYLRIPDLLKAAGKDAFANLRVLNAYWNCDEQLEISDHLTSMPRLQALSVEVCRCTSVPALLRLITSLPPALTHLNVCQNNFGAAVVEVTKHKERLAQLHRLNIGTHNQEEEREAIREELQQLNPDIKVYHKSGESLWEMY